MNDAINITNSDVKANETILTITINDNEFPQAISRLIKMITELNNEEVFFKFHHDRQIEELEQDRQDELAEMGSKGIYDAEHDSSLELKYQYPSDMMEEPTGRELREARERLDYSSDIEQDRIREARADIHWVGDFSE